MQLYVVAYESGIFSLSYYNNGAELKCIIITLVSTLLGLSHGWHLVF